MNITALLPLPAPDPIVLAPTRKPRAVRPCERRGAPNIAVGDWETSELPDAAYGLTAMREAHPVDLPKVGYNVEGLRLTERDRIIMDFLARYRYASLAQLVRLTDASEVNLAHRLNRLRAAGLLLRHAVSGKTYVYTTTQLAHEVLGVAYPAIRVGEISMAHMPHTAGLAELGMELERTGGRPVLGAVSGVIGTLTERELRWGATTEQGTRFPDLVVLREPDLLGRSQDIAVELELHPKSPYRWLKILRWYRDSSYDTVAYVVPDARMGSKLWELAGEVDMQERLMLLPYAPECTVDALLGG